MRFAECLHSLQKAWLWEIESGIRWDGLEDDAGDLGALFHKDGLECLQIVKGNGGGECRQ
jgi:hypothetical protein